MENKRMKNKKPGILAAVPVLLIACMIFLFSGETAEQSRKVSGSLTRQILRVVISDFDALPEEEQIALVRQTHFWVRKAAHLTEYLLLGLSSAVCFNVWKVKFPFLTAQICGSLYAATDEVHQLFVDSRSGELRDFLIDSFGVFLGMMICRCIIMIIRKKKKRDA